MKAMTNFYRCKFSTRGQIVIPAKLRKKLRLREGTEMFVEMQGTAVVLTPLPKEPKPPRVPKAPTPNHVYEPIMENGQQIGHIWRWVGQPQQ